MDSFSVCMYVCMYVYIHACKYITYLYTYICIPIHMRRHTHTYACAYKVLTDKNLDKTGQVGAETSRQTGRLTDTQNMFWAK